MLRALKNSFQCANKSRKRSRSCSQKQNDLLFHMAECASFREKDEVIDGQSIPFRQERQHQRKRSDSTHHSSFPAGQGRNNSMNDFHEMLQALRNVGLRRRRPSDLKNVEEVAEDSSGQITTTVASRVTPSATPLLHRKNTQEVQPLEQPDGSPNGERFISEYSVRLEPVIKICIPCQHEHGPVTATTSGVTAKVTSLQDTEATLAENTSTTTTTTEQQQNFIASPARVEVAVESIDPETAPNIVVSSLGEAAAAGDENSKRSLAVPLITSLSSISRAKNQSPEVPRPLTKSQASPIVEVSSESQPGRTGGDVYPIERSEENIGTMMMENKGEKKTEKAAKKGERKVEIAKKEEKKVEAMKKEEKKTAARKKEEKIEAVKEEKIKEATKEGEKVKEATKEGEKVKEAAKIKEKAVVASAKKETEEDSTLEVPAAASEVEISRREALIMASTTADAAEIDALMLETEPSSMEKDQDSDPETASIEKETPVPEKAEEKEVVEAQEVFVDEEEDATTLADLGSKQLEPDRENTSTPTSVSLASFVDVYDKEPMHPTDDARSSVSPMHQRPPAAPSCVQVPTEEAIVASWLQGTRDVATSADRWKFMKQLVKDREASSSGSKQSQSAKELGDKHSEQSGGDGAENTPRSTGESATPVNDELRDILSKLKKKRRPVKESPFARSSESAAARTSKISAQGEQSKAGDQGPDGSRGRESSRPSSLYPCRRRLDGTPTSEAPSRAYTYQIYLDHSDPIVCSFLRRADRRVVAAASKNNCAISVSSDEAGPHFRKYHCVIKGPTRAQVMRCINFLKDTFPKSFIRYNR